MKKLGTMKIVGSFISDGGDSFSVGKRDSTYYFSCKDFGEGWLKIDISRYIFSNEELISINTIIHTDIGA